MLIEKISLSDLKKHIGVSSTIIIDVRNQSEYDEIHIQGVTHIPLKEIPNHVEEFKNFTTIITLCAHGVRSKKAAEDLQMFGCTAMYVLGDIENWKKEGLPVIYES